MALTAYGKNVAIAAVAAKTNPTSAMEYAGLAESLKEPSTSATLVGASLINMTGAKAKGFTNGKIVMIRKLSAGVTGLVEERPYFVVGEVTNGFELALEEGGAAIKVGGVEAKTNCEYALITELTGGGYARVKTTWGAAANGEIEDTGKPNINVPAGKTITDAMWWSGSGSGRCLAVAKLAVAETYGAEGKYELSTDKLESNPATVA